MSAIPCERLRSARGRRGRGRRSGPSIWSCTPATRTMKNSSRLVAKIARNFRRSISGSDSSSASWSTRSLKSSQDSSRLMYSDGSVEIADRDLAPRRAATSAGVECVLDRSCHTFLRPPRSRRARGAQQRRSARPCRCRRGRPCASAPARRSGRGASARTKDRGRPAARRRGRRSGRAASNGLAGERAARSVTSTPSGSQASSRGLERAQLRAATGRRRCCTPSAAERSPRRPRPGALPLGQGPLIVRRTVRRLGMAQQPEHA